MLPFILVVLLTVACSPAPELRNNAFLADTSLITGNPCEAPCWEELTPGETVWGLAQEKITGDYVEVDSDSNRRTGEAWIEFSFGDGLKCCRIYTADGQVLSSILLLLAPEITLSDVIERYGEPTYLTAQSETSDQAYLALVYPEIPMIIYAFAETITDSQISPDTEIIGLVYLSGPEMGKLLSTQSLYDWDGYGILGDVIDGNFDITPVPQTDENDSN